MEDIPAIYNCHKTLTFTSITVQTAATVIAIMCFTTMWKNIICIIHFPPMQQVSLIFSATFPLYIDILLKVRLYIWRSTWVAWWYILNQENQWLKNGMWGHPPRLNSPRGTNKHLNLGALIDIRSSLKED